MLVLGKTYQKSTSGSYSMASLSLSVRWTSQNSTILQVRTHEIRARTRVLGGNGKAEDILASVVTMS